MAAGGPPRDGDAAASDRNAAAMPDFFALLQELVGLTAREAPAPELRSVEARFRAALPKIMRRFFAPANGASVKERELLAVLKLLAHITKHCPGVFQCSDGAATILLVISYLLPCFAEQLYKGMGQPLSEALAGLLSLLWKENRQLYISFFVDLLRLLEDLVSVASFFSKPSLFTDCTEVSVQAFSSTYLAAVENASDDISALWPDRISLPGVMLNLTGKERWQPVATWMIDLAHHCLMEGASHISGLVGPTTFDILMSFLSFDEPSLHKETELTSQTVQLLGLLFEAIDKLLAWHATRPSLHESRQRSVLRWEDLLREDLWEPTAFGRFLLLPWSLTLDDIHSEIGMLKIRLRATRLAASAYNATLEEEVLQKVLRAGLEDKEAQLRAASVILIAGLVPLLDKASITQFWMSVRSLARDPADTVRWSVARAIGLAGCCSAGCTVKCLKHTHQSGWIESNKFSRKQEIDSVLGPAAACASLEHPSCSLCDAHNRAPYLRTPPGSAEVEIGGVLAAEPVHHCEDPDVSILWQSLSQQLLFEEPSAKVQAEFVLSGGRILRHALPEVLKQGSRIWLQFLDQEPLHPDWPVRAAFGSIAGTHFTQNPPCRFMSLSALEGLFGDMSEQAGSNFELTDATEVKRQALEMLSNLRSHFRNAKEPEIRQTLMTAVKEVARACAKGSELLFFCLVLLLEQLDSSLPVLTSAAIDSIKQIACLHWPKSCPSSVHGMLETFKEELYDYLSSCLISQPVLVMVFAEEVMSVSLKELVKSMTPMVIPKLVIEQHGNEQALAVLRRIAEVLDLELPQLLVDWAHKVLAFIEALLVELVFILGDAKTSENPHRSERVASTFNKITRIMSNSEDLPSFLREYLVGILNSIEYKLLRANEHELKRKGLRCIDKLADFIGPHLSAFVPKFTGLLTNALEVAALQVQALGVWRRFIRILATVAPLKLRSIASQIVVAVLPCLELADDGKDEVKIAATADVLEELAVKNKDILRDKLKELPLLPRLEALKNVNSVLQEVRGSLSLCQQLQQATEGLRHETLSINYVAAIELKKLIREHRHGVDTLVTTESSSQAEAISQLVAALLRICILDSRSPLSQRLRLLCAECLGELGAVDPGRLQVELPQRPHIDRDDDDLIFELINEHLAKAFRSAPDGEVQDSAALAIQELLKLCGCAPPCTGQIMPSVRGRNGTSRSGPHCDDLRLERGGAASSRRGEQLWQRFSEDVRDIIAPCLTSRFVLSRPKSNHGSAVPGPLYSHGLTFRRWVYLWGRHLLSLASSSRSKIFVCCKAIFKNDMGVALFLLPYIVLDVISTGNQAAKDEVCQGILAVLVAPSTSEDREASSHGIVNVGAADADSDASVWEVATQLIFTLLDSLSQWVDRTKQNLRQDSAQQAEDFKSKSRSRKIEDKALQCQHVEELLAAIPKEALARASYRCKAYARALLYFEFHVRERCGTLNPAAEKSGSFCAEDVSFLLEMYSGLDEPDGLAGLSRLRGSITSLQDQMLIHEKAGNWAEALTCYEQALETTPHGLKLHQGVLGCLLNMGHLQALITQVDGLIARLPSESKELELPGEQVVQMTAKTLLQLARWVHHTGQKQKEEVVALYLRVKELQPKWEKAFFYMAKYYDDLLCDARRRQDEAIPDYTVESSHHQHHHISSSMCYILAYIRGCKEDLPAYQWLTALPQLVSRICHQNEGVLELTKQLIMEVLRRYPQQALWTMAAVSKSALSARRQAATDVLDGAKNSLIRDEDRILFTQFPAFIEQMIRLCFHAGQPKQKMMSISSDFGQLKRMMPLDVVLPLQRALTVAMPPDGLTDRGFNAFPVGEHATILGICEDVEILQSLQRPKKVVLLGSDGREHPFLCKPKDDLRKDARMMEFTTMINRLLSKNSASRRRNLHIRTFAVLPLTEDCGMIEWTLHTRGLRHILQDIYMACGKFDRQKTNPTIKKIYDQMADADRSEAFRTRILSMFPPMFHKWLLNTFTEPAAWFRAGMNFAHTAAVWSMVGHIVGLGDRHGENILLDSTDGACVHVDFSCLFDKGLALEKPELVPFRLTQNMVDGLGITGYEGVFLRVCEITLNVLRVHRETLINVLETFIHDPLVEWTKSHKSSGTEIQNPHAQRALANIKDRLQGVVVGVNVAPSLPLSVEGQAHRLITLAVSHDNLSKMYIWWMPWF
eukprot:SM000001S04662  [mRNA]  locus=s1:1542427:1556327:- [translate_table: standard]